MPDQTTPHTGPDRTGPPWRTGPSGPVAYPGQTGPVRSAGPGQTSGPDRPDQLDRRVTGLFYAATLTTSLAGASLAAQHWLDWPLPAAVCAVAVYELGGVALSVHADHRRQLGERAIAARLLSVAVAGGAVAVNWFGHDHVGLAGFFAGMSALGYLVWLMRSGAKRRDRLRATGHLAATTPAYGLHWLTGPVQTARARLLARANPELGLFGSIELARQQSIERRRQAAVARLLRRRLSTGPDRTAADIAVTVYDLDRVAGGLVDRADYAGLTGLLAAGLDPVALTSPDRTGPLALEADRSEQTSPADQGSGPDRVVVEVDQTDVQRTRPRRRVDRSNVTPIGQAVRQAVVDAQVLIDRYGDDIPGRNVFMRELKWGASKASNALAEIRRMREEGAA